jgi:hypothetical protein
MRARGLKYPVVGVVLTTVKNLTGHICKKIDQFDFLFLFLFNVIAHFESSCPVANLDFVSVFSLWA